MKKKREKNAAIRANSLLYRPRVSKKRKGKKNQKRRDPENRGKKTGGNGGEKRK